MTVQLFRPSYDVEACVDAVRDVLQSGWTGLGPHCAAFEKEWNERLGNDTKCHFVSSATAALHIAVRLLDLPKGSVIATTPLTFVSTNAAILYEGHTPVFCDCGNDLSLSFESVRRAIEKKKAKAVIWVHYGGNVSPEFYYALTFCRAKGIPIIEDCAHAAGASYLDGTPVGSQKDTISCFSFHSVKNLPIFDGGLLCTRDAKTDERARRLSWMGIDKNTYVRTENSGNELYKWSYNVPELGWKYNGNDIAAVIGMVQLKHLDRDNAYRLWLADIYEQQLETRMLSHQRGSSHHLAVVFVKDRDKVIGDLKAAGYAPGVHYLPNYMFPVFEKYDHSLCRNIEGIKDSFLSLPNHLEVLGKDVRRIAGVVRNA